MLNRLLFACFLLVVCARVGAADLREVALGDSCMEQFDLFHALQYYEAALHQQDNALVRMRIAECHYRRHDYAKCIQVLKPLPEDSMSHEALRQVCYSCKQLGDLGGQTYWASAVVQRYPADGEMVAEWGTALVLQNMPDQAIKVCTPYWLKDQQNAAVNRALGDAYFINRNFELARMLYDSLVAAGDSTYAVFFNLGVCHERLDCPQKARTCFDEAIARSDSAIAGALYHQGAVLNALGEADKALACFSKALSVLAPDELQMFTCYRGMGESYYTQKKYREAAYAFHDALRYDATSLTTYYYLGICQAALGDQREAAKQLRTFLSIAEQMESPTESLKEMMDDARRRTLR